MKFDGVSRLAWVLLSVALVTLFWRHQLFGTGVVSIGIQALSVGLWIWARLTFGRRSFHGSASPTAGGLVTTGPYRFWRHPIYASILYFILAGVAAHPSALSGACGGLAALAVTVRIGSEERLLRERYPEYAAYARGTKRLVPFLL
ncbi:MAG TPA: isoprenylcysteine carboxylmethyltransferase family protein [Gemmatimonadales bacterium]|jgi:protein-S-isoprenylcysteine O-methyltransferase Ste14